MADKPKKETGLPEIVLLGDSLTEWSFFEHNRGFGWVLQEMYKGKARVVNEGKAGWTSTLLIPNFTHLLTRATSATTPPTLLITIFLGANDACFTPTTTRLRSSAEDFIGTEIVPLPRFEETLRFFIEEILIADRLAEFGTKVVLMGPPPISIPRRQGSRRAYATYLSKKRYAEAVVEVARSYAETGRVVGVDVWRAMVGEVLGEEEGGVDACNEERLPGCGLEGAREFEAGVEGYFVDGLHLGTKGYEVVSREWLKVVLETWPELAPEKLGLEV
ncbi:SGNH hydrolase [Westerdykella ornata]|uniref:SGNH hydrolase n=1 Tax=Westerdykella ornata TaxID=318751 RepID=A0A6A6JB82_WESOR|nr:SGNH hydrolase [Westerdykella ornata]KAF2273545.1 SGNH hydrolase [Westerdykella ornata]